MIETSVPSVVLLPSYLQNKRAYRICTFNAWAAKKDFVRCTDTGLIKSGKKIYALGKHCGQAYRFPACRAVFIFAGESF